jgi:hypothetical protein
VGIDKLDVRVKTLGDHGEKLDTLLEAAKVHLARTEGEKQAYTQVLQKIQGLGSIVDRELEEGKFSEFGENAMPVAALVKKWIMRAGGVADNLRLRADANIMLGQGQITGLTAAVKFTQKEYDAGLEKLRSVQNMVDRGIDPEDAERSQVLSPAEDIAKRREEARKEKEAKTAEERASQEEKPKAPSTPPKALPSGKPAKAAKKTGRRGKNT